MYPHLFQKGLMHDTILTKEADGTIATQGLAMICSHVEQGGFPSPHEACLRNVNQPIS